MYIDINRNTHIKNLGIKSMCHLHCKLKRMLKTAPQQTTVLYQSHREYEQETRHKGEDSPVTCHDRKRGP